jgi:NodT family efflux transporter outer membrane factor (OMF) lipoprotein
MTQRRSLAKSSVSISVVTGIVLIAGCTLGPDYKSPDDATPGSWFSARPKQPETPSRTVSEPIDPAWWQLFGDPQLTALVQRVAGANLDVRLAAIRIEESRAERGVVAAAQFPTIEGNASYVRQQASNRGIFTRLGSNAAGSGRVANGTVGGAGAISGVKIEPFEAYQYGLDASWELDLWGRVRRAVESSDASITASQEALRGALLSSLAEVARDYMELRGAQLRLQIARDNLKTSRQSQGIVAQRAAGGLATDLDAANAAAQVSTVAADIPRIEQEEARLMNALGLLLGEPPQSLRAELETPKPIPPVPPEIPVGFPSELAQRRPDIRQADANLHSATADIGVAEANFYPSVTLNGSIGIQALRTQSLWNWNAQQYAIGPSLNIPIFEGGRLKSQLALRKAQQRESAVKYQQTVLTAWNEVDDALSAYEFEQRRRAQLMEAVKQNRRALALAQNRYKEGISDFIEVLDAQRQQLATEQLLAISTTNVSGNLVALYKALGGGWEPDLPVGATSP